MLTVCSIPSSTSLAYLKRHLAVFHAAKRNQDKFDLPHRVARRLRQSGTDHFSVLAFVLIFCAVLFMQSVICIAQEGSPEPQLLELKGDLRVHDPVMIRQGEIYYVFSTGGGAREGGFIPIRCSKDLIEWKQCGFVFEELPAWASKEIPGTRSPWAPDISYFNGRYHIYYSISTFGKNNSAIGLVTNKTLDATSADYKWEDQGMVLRSTTGVTDWNAIDPNLILEGEDKAWLAWGSF